ncbi:Putative LOC100645362 [Caligus rogercresseyi]|uniref:LOC100645362 n=1 Tax=Caligus rogercresseyi TaxID=217165 RepID=A0A7T8HIH7_CALRO|nr:Putative LOC100645362 [Caligus rogercresseyi]
MEEEVSKDDIQLGFFDLPIELHVKILMLLDPLDVLSYSSVCKISNKIGETHRVWRSQWKKLRGKTPLSFPVPSPREDRSLNYKDACKRLWCVLVDEGPLGPFRGEPCSACKEFTCLPSCMEDRNDKIALDIGGKITWLLTADFSLKRHLSMLAVPKVLRCYDCDTTLHRQECRMHHLIRNPLAVNNAILNTPILLPQ